jgi:hypothetical protein
MPKVGFRKLHEIIQVLQVKSGELKSFNQGFSLEPILSLICKVFMILNNGLNMRLIGSQSWLPDPPEGKIYCCWSWKPASLSLQVPQSQAGGILFLGLWVETGLVKESICTAHSTGKSLIACMDQRRRAERGDICAWKRYTQEEGRKTPRKLKGKNRE